MIGTPQEKDMEFIAHDEVACKYLKLFKPCEPENLHEKYPATDKRGMDLLKRMSLLQKRQSINQQKTEI